MHFWHARTRRMKASTRSTMTCSFSKRSFLQVTSPKMELTSLISRALKDIRSHRMLFRNWWAQVNQVKDWVIPSRHRVIFRCKITLVVRLPHSKIRLSDNPLTKQSRLYPTLIAKTSFSLFSPAKLILTWILGLWITWWELSRDLVLLQTPMLVRAPTSVFLNALTTSIAKMPNSRIWRTSFACLISIRTRLLELQWQVGSRTLPPQWRRQHSLISTAVLNTSTQTTEWP